MVQSGERCENVKQVEAQPFTITIWCRVVQLLPEHAQSHILVCVVDQCLSHVLDLIVYIYTAYTHHRSMYLVSIKLYLKSIFFVYKLGLQFNILSKQTQDRFHNCLIRVL
jgi:hypothetical protein